MPTKWIVCQAQGASWLVLPLLHTAGYDQYTHAETHAPNPESTLARFRPLNLFQASHNAAVGKSHVGGSEDRGCGPEIPADRYHNVFSVPDELDLRRNLWPSEMRPQFGSSV